MPISNPDLTQAILQMPTKEKDKLLLRLIAKDYKLQTKLEFELLEGQAEMISRRNEILGQIANPFSGSDIGDTPGWVMMSMRDVSGTIREHIRVTKDKFGEVLLTVELLHEVIKRKKDLLFKMQNRTDTFAPYYAKKVADILKKAEKLHPDYHLEFRENLNEVLEFVHAYPPCKGYVREFAIPKDWEDGL